MDGRRGRRLFGAVGEKRARFLSARCLDGVFKDGTIVGYMRDGRMCIRHLYRFAAMVFRKQRRIRRIPS